MLNVFWALFPILLEVMYVFYSSAVSGDLLGLSTPPTNQPNAGNTGVLLDVLGDIYSGKSVNNTNNSQSLNLYNPKKYVTQN